MAELTKADAVAYSRGRLADDAETERLLFGVLAGARRACGWHVSPVITETLELDGPGGLVLSVPSLRVVELIEVIENGVSIPVDDLVVSKRRGLVRKRSGACWTSLYGGVTVTLQHGLDEEEAGDWRVAVLEATNRLAVDKFRGDMSVTRKRVDDVDVYWSERIVGEFESDPSLGRFRILPSP